MEVSLFNISVALFFILLIIKRFTRNHRRLPPTAGPALPILGHIHLLKPPLHRTLLRLSQTHGPIFSLKLGVRRLVVVSSPDLVEECFNKNDVVLANRPWSMVDKYISYNRTTVSAAPHGHHWRSLRRLMAQEVFSSSRLNSFSEIRQEEVRRTLQTLIRTEESNKLQLRPMIFELIFSITMRMLVGKRYSAEEKDDQQLGERFREMVSEVFEHAQSSNPEDFLPILRWIDYKGLKKKLIDLTKRLDDFYEGLLEEHRREKRSTIVGHLLSLQESEPEFYTDQIIKGFITIMLLAGTDTSSVTIEWAMSALLNHTEKMDRARAELDNLVGNERLVNESDLPNLPYLQNIIYETFRLFPATPLLVPHEASADCKVGGFDIPKDTILLTNAWAIHRDPTVWDDPMSFKPERFEVGEFGPPKLMPFGMGRRACPGNVLAQRVVGLAIASLIQCFEWRRIDEELVDLTEGVGLSMPKKIPLEARCKPRLVLQNVFAG